MRNKILVFSFFLVILPIVIFYLSSSRIINNQLSKQITSQVRISQKNLADLIEARVKKLGNDVVELTQGEKFRFAVTYELQGDVKKAVEAFKSGGGYDYVIVFNSKEEVLVKNGLPPLIKFDRALFSAKAVGFEQLGNAIALNHYAVIPEADGPDVGGYLLVGNRVDKRFAETLSQNVGSHVLFFAGRQAVTGTLEQKLALPEGALADFANFKDQMSYYGRLFNAEIGHELFVLGGINLPAIAPNAPPLSVCTAISGQILNEAKAQNRNAMILTAAFCVVAALSVSLLFLSRSVLIPIQKLLTGVTKVSQGDLTHHVQLESRDELQLLADAYNQMTVDLKKSKDEIEQWNRELEEKVKMRTLELKQSNEALGKTNGELNKTLQDLKTAQNQLIQSEKMASLGQMVSGVAHEINNPTNFISGGANNLKTKIQEFSTFLFELMGAEESTSAIGQEIKARIEDLHKMIQTIYNGAERVKKIVLSLRTFSRLDEAQFKEVDLHDGIDSTLEILHFKFKNRIEVVKKYGVIPPVECNASQINQVIMNLLVNAADAIEGNGTVDIETFRENETVWIQVADTGSGIPADKIGKIFDPFYTTKEVGKGTGLGLSISYGIIKDHQGQILVDSQVGQGTTFKIQLPIHHAENKVG